ADAGRMYEAMLAFLYAHGGRYGAHELAEFLGRYRTAADESGAAAAQIAEPMLDGDVSQSHNERTPVEGPQTRAMQASVSRFERGQRSIAVDRAAEMGERREVTALVIELPRAVSVEHAKDVILRYGGRVIKQEAGQIAALFGLGEPDGRDTKTAT